jgi:hypothetical protein
MSDAEAFDASEPSVADDDAVADELSVDVLSAAAEDVDWSVAELDDDPPEQAVIATAARTATSDVVSKRMYFSL